MVDNTILWTQRYTSPKYGLEPKTSLKYLQEYLEMDYPRTIRGLCKRLNAKRKQDNCKTQIRETTLYGYSCKYDWSMREDAHDTYYSNIREKKKKIDTEKWESTQLRKAMQRVNMHNGSFDRLHGDKDIPINKKIYAESENEDAYSTALDNVYKIRFGGTPPNKNINQSDVTASVKTEETISHNLDETVIKELSDVIKPRHSRDD